MIVVLYEDLGLSRVGRARFRPCFCFFNFYILNLEMRLPLLFLLPLIAYSVITPISFEEWKTRFGKSYPNATEDAHRRELFQANLKNLLNSNCDTCGITKFAADSPQEISSRTNLLLPPNIEDLARKQAQATIVKVGTSDSIATSQTYLKLAAPSSLDWRDQGAVTSVKAQGSCGTCWSFTTVAMCESSLILKGNAWNNKLYEVDLSEQYLLKCTPGSSCSGGYLQKSIDKALEKGLPTDEQFPYNPYSSSNSGVCSTNDLLPISNATRISKYSTNDDTIITMLAAGPIAAAVSAVGWENYDSGVFQCQSNSAINHAVLLVGYTPDYWIIKNSWGSDWGQSGYIHVTRNTNNNCGIGTAVHMLTQPFILLGLIMVLLALLI